MTIQPCAQAQGVLVGFLKLDGFLKLNEKKILDGLGAVSHKEMEQKVRKELENYNRKQLK